LELYHSGLTTCSKQVRLCLREKDIPYTSHYIELWNYENLNPDYLKLNPNGVVPTLVHDGRPLFNSFVITEYIEDNFPGNPLRPADLMDRARMRLWTWTADDVHLATTMITYANVLQDRVDDDLSAADKELMLASTPVPERRRRWTRLSQGGFTREEMEASLEKCTHCMGRMEAALDPGPWLAGADYSLADIHMLSIVHRFRELYPELLDPKDYPRVTDWQARMMARPAVAWVYSPDTEEVPGRPKGKSVSGIKRTG
jgi:glutathione S-transferase